MNRSDFTVNIAKLILFAVDNGYHVVGDWFLRDDETQKRMFLAGKSKCDGKNKRSKHQDGKALDIYIIEDGKISESKSDYIILHDYWLTLGGEPMLSWDQGHFEG